MRAPAVILDDTALNAKVTYHPSYLPKADADVLFAWMLEHTPWQTEAPVVFGKAREVTRRTFSYGTEGLRYRYSRIERVAVAWPEPLLPVVGRLRSEFGAPFNYALCNLYPDGEANISKHSDSEPDIVRDSPIAGLSLGATRDFALYRRGGGRVANVELEHGSVIVMWGATQRHFQHAVPERKRVHEARVNVTFRVMKARSQ